MTKALALLFFLPGLLTAQINVAFHNGGTTVNGMSSRPDGTVVATSVDTWNNPSNNGGQTLSFTNFALLDRSGAATTATLDATSGFSSFNNNGWGAGTDDHVMMEGWYGFRSTESITVNNLPASYSSGGYSVIIYGDPKSPGRSMNYTVNDGITSPSKTLVDAALFNGTFTEDIDFVTFSGFSGATLTITGNPGAGDARSAVNGFIIVPGILPTPPEITSFTADDHYVTPGTTVTLDWTSTGADTLILNPGNIPVTVTGTTTADVTVSATTTYTLTATNTDGSDVATVRVGAGPPRPNILVFLVDDMGPHDTSVPFILNGGGTPVSHNFNSFYQTPNMEALASSGMRFTTAYAQSVCSPTRCGIMTGRNSIRHAVTDWVGANDAGSPSAWRINGIDASDVTLPKQLQSGGYRTIHVGKAHFSKTQVKPEDLGFDVNIGGSHWGHPWSGYIGTAGYGGGMPGLEGYDGSQFLTKALTTEANQALEDAVDDGTPFFLHMAFYAVHSPFTTNPDATGNYSAAVSTNHEKFATMIEGMDIAVGEIRQKLVDLGVADDTLILFLGDNGSDSPATTQDGLPSGTFSDWPMRGKKGSKWEGGSRVPFIATWAAADVGNSFQQAIPIPANSIQPDIITTWDVPVTLLDVAGLSSAPNFGEDGHSLVPYLAGTPGTHRPQEVVIHYPHEHRSDFFTWIRQGDMKLIYNFQSNSHQLYNLATDPTETNNLAAVQPETVMQMARALAQHLGLGWGPSGILLPTIASSAPAGNVVSIPNLPTVDLDADGIPDNNEDPNSNGLLDPGETDPDNDNTDGDDTPDGAELKTGTDPLDPQSYFRILDFEIDPSDHILLTWPSAPGALYRVESHTTLVGAWSLVQDDVPADAVNPSTIFDAGPIPVDDVTLYRSILK